MTKRAILEGTWSGYSSSQERIVHREVMSEKRAEKFRDVYGIRYTDGTMLYLNLRMAKPRERVQVINGYNSLISDCEHYGVWSVAELADARKRLKEAR